MSSGLIMALRHLLTARFVQAHPANTEALHTGWHPANMDLQNCSTFQNASSWRAGMPVPWLGVFGLGQMRGDSAGWQSRRAAVCCRSLPLHAETRSVLCYISP